MTRASSRTAFSLLELLASMALLSVVLLILSTVLTQATRLARINTARARLTNQGRAALDLLARDLEQAITAPTWGSNLNMVVTASDSTSGHVPYGTPAAAIAFHRLHPPGADDREHTPRDIQQILYAVKQNGVNDEEDTSPTGTFSLRRVIAPVSELNAIPVNWINPLWETADAIVLDNIAGFLIATDEHPEPNPEQFYDRLPGYIDVYLELLTPDDAERALTFQKPEWRSSFLERQVIRLSRRISLPNRYPLDDS
jgi:prepilin-type N-terminal cleavage/methylation domain-containing protein